MSIVVSGLSKQYGPQWAVDDISFEINEGEIVGFLGPNGAGKSTTMKMLSCYLPPTKGTAKINGFDIIDNPIDVKKQIGYLPENNPLYNEMYIREYLLFSAGIHKLRNKKDDVESIIETVGLTLERKKKIKHLSKGYRQRVGLALALLHKPQVLILDEPTSGLDPNQLSEIRSLIRDIGKEKTVIISTHIMQEVQAICDRVIIISKGKIVANDSTENLLKSRAKNFNVIVEFKENVSKEMLQKLPFVESVVSGNINCWILMVRKTDRDIRELIFEFAKENELTLLESKIQESSLEEIFKELTSN